MAEIIVEETGKLLKLDLLRKAPFPGSVSHRFKGNLQRKQKLWQLRFWQ